MEELKCHCGHCRNSTCIAPTHGMCMSEIILNTRGELEPRSFCLNKTEPRFNRLLCGNSRTAIRKCCSDKSFCNKQDTFMPRTEAAEEYFLGLEDTHRHIYFENHMSPFIIIATSLIFMQLTVYYTRNWTRNNKATRVFQYFYRDSQKKRTQNDHIQLRPMPSCVALNMDDRNDLSSSSSRPALNARSISWDVDMCEVVGSGRYGVVWRGRYKGSPVAAKIFSPESRSCWERETDIYMTNSLRHRNILGFIASDEKLNSPHQGYWIVTEYYPVGSLTSFLRYHTLSLPSALRMAHSIVNGLVHLHTEIRGHPGKPAIAHRDIKSSNILVRNDGTCCIADLGFAVRFISKTGMIDSPSDARVGTRRYLAPELIEGSVNIRDFETFKYADVYSLSLVLWEIMLRTSPTASTTMKFLVSPILDFGQRVFGVDPFGPQYGIKKPLYIEEPESLGDLSETSEPSLDSRKLASPASSPVAGPSKSAGPTDPSERARLAEAHANLYMASAQDKPLIRGQADAAGARKRSTCSASTVDDSWLDELTVKDSATANGCDPYMIPYEGMVSKDSTLEEMRRVVCDARKRPEMRDRWFEDKALNEWSRLIAEGWLEQPSSRVTALRMRARIAEIAQTNYNLNLEFD